MKTLLAIITAVAIPLAASQATLLVYEGFDYTANQALTNNIPIGGTGWSQDLGTDGSIDVRDGGLSYANLQVGGNSSEFTVDNTDIYRETTDLSSYYDEVGESIFISFLVYNQGGFENMRWLGDDGGGDGVGFGRGSSDSSWAIRTPLAGSSDSFTVDGGITNLLVLQVDILAVGSGEDRDVDLSAYLNPASLGGAAPATPTMTYTNVSVALDADEFRFDGDDGTVVDELRYGTTFADVTPTGVIPEPATFSLTVLGTLVACWLRRRNRT